MASARQRTSYGLTDSERRWRYVTSILATFAVINPLVLYRFDAIKDDLLLNNLFDFTDFWSENPVGGSWLELIYWAIAKMPGYHTIAGMDFPWQAKAILGIVIGAATIYLGYGVYRKAWLGLTAFNRGWAVITFLKKAAIIGGPVAIVMLAMNWLAGTTFTYWTIFEIVFWLLLIVFGAVIAAGLCWNFDTRREAGVGGVNVTMGDDDDFNG
ncbi:MAG: hypothetical protein R3C97_02280 [Geminicoccaceae bacterium]